MSTDNKTMTDIKSLSKQTKTDDRLTQSERFIKAAQELGTDDDPERFAERVRKLTKATPASQGPAETRRNRTPSK